ncbi:hypothetical protein Tco_1367967 [Tanacetum coccineum]
MGVTLPLNGELRCYSAQPKKWLIKHALLFLCKYEGRGIKPINVFFMAKVHITYLETSADIELLGSGLLQGFREGEKETYECLSQWCSYHLVSRSHLNSVIQTHDGFLKAHQSIYGLVCCSQDGNDGQNLQLVPVDDKPDKPKQLVPKQQYNHERECNLIIGQIRDDKVLRLECLMDGILSAEEFKDEELASLKIENMILKENYENQPEVLRT